MAGLLVSTSFGAMGVSATGGVTSPDSVGPVNLAPHCRLSSSILSGGAWGTEWYVRGNAFSGAAGMRGNCENSSFRDEDSTPKYIAKGELAMIATYELPLVISDSADKPFAQRLPI